MSNNRPLFDEIRNSHFSIIEGFISVWIIDNGLPYFHLISIKSIKNISYFYCPYEITIDYESGQLCGLLDESKGEGLFDLLRSLKDKSGCLIYLNRF